MTFSQSRNENLEEIPVDTLDPNIFATRYSEDAEIDELAQSIKTHGQLESIGVRRNPSDPDRYQIIYGHRRVAAIRRLGLKTVRAELKDIDDRMMLQMAVVENLQRQNISDYEKGLLFRNLSDNFELTYEEVGRIIGKSKQLVSNHIAMTRLFSDKDLKEDTELRRCLFEISEAHARVLGRIVSSQERSTLLKIAVRDHLCAGELRALSGSPRDPQKNSDSVEWIRENMRYKFDNTHQMKSKHGRVCILRVESLNYLISQLRVSPYVAGAKIAQGAAEILRERGIEPRLRKNWSKILVEKSKYAGWGRMSTTTDSKLVVHDPTINSEFLRGYLENVFGIELRCAKNNARIQVFDIISNRNEEKQQIAILTKG
jgi:ParB/RepB/Spo0J family partition protein